MSESRQIEIRDLTEDEWNEIRRIAVAIHKTGQYGDSQFKSSIQAFVVWMGQQPEEVSVLCESLPEDTETIH